MPRGEAESADRSLGVPRVVLVSAPLNYSGGIGRVMTGLLTALPEHERPIAVLDTRGPQTAPWHCVFPLLRVLASLGSLIRRSAVDVVHVNISSHGSAIRKLIVLKFVTRRGVPVVLHLHASSFPEFFDHLPSFAQRSVRRGFRTASTVIVLGEIWREFAHTVLGVDDDRLVVVPNAVAGPEHLEPNRRSEQEPLELLFLGQLCERKGTPDVLEALSALPDTARWHAVLAGDGDVDSHRARARALRLGDRVEFLGWVEEARAQKLLSRAHVLMLPSYAEGLPMSVLEAMAQAVVPVTSNVGALPEAVQHGRNGLIVSPGKPGQLADALNLLFDDEDLRVRLAHGARATWQTKYRMDEYAAVIQDIWRTAAVDLPRTARDGRR